jgi:hypothetical protein
MGKKAQRPIIYSMIGFDDKDNSFARAEVEAQEAAEIADERGLNRYLLAPTRGTDYPALGTRSMLKLDGKWRRVELWQWMEATFSYVPLCEHQPAKVRRPKRGIRHVRIDHATGNVTSWME